MKNFSTQAIYFSSIFIVLNLVVYFILVKPALFEKYIYNENHINNYNLVLVSDSHGAYIQNTPNEYGIFNLSSTGDNYHDMYLKIKYFSKFLSNKDTILLSIDNHQLSSYRNGPGNVKKNVIYTDDITEIDSSYVNLKDYYLKQQFKYLPFLNVEINRDISKYVYFSLDVDKMDRFPQSINDLDSLTIQNNCKTRFKAQFENQTKSYEQVKYLKKIIELCKINSITLVGIKFPITDTYWELIKNNGFGIDDLLIEYNIDIIDLHDLFFSENRYFKDQDHLNTLGGTLFSKEIKVRLRKNELR
jgi:hypothetical protein